MGIQRNLGESTDSILEGRDIGTVVFPKADFKFFLVASNDIRAQRRLKELEEKGIKIGIEELKKQIEQRDRQDSTRASAPLKKAENAVEIDTSNMNIDEVIEYIVSCVKKS